MIPHFQVYFGKPKKLDYDCTQHNRAFSRGVTLHADYPWGFEQPIDPAFMEYPACQKLLSVCDELPHKSEIYRFWFLWKNPEYCYLDSDCINHGWTPPNDGRVYLPSVTKLILDLCKRRGIVGAEEKVKNTSGEWPDVFIIYANGNGAFFKWLLDTWAEKYPNKGGCAEVITYEPCDIGIIPENTYRHLSTRKD